MSLLAIAMYLSDDPQSLEEEQWLANQMANEPVSESHPDMDPIEDVEGYKNPFAGIPDVEDVDLEERHEMLSEEPTALKDDAELEQEVQYISQKHRHIPERGVLYSNALQETRSKPLSGEDGGSILYPEDDKEDDVSTAQVCASIY